MGVNRLMCPLYPKCSKYYDCERKDFTKCHFFMRCVQEKMHEEKLIPNCYMSVQPWEFEGKGRYNKFMRDKYREYIREKYQVSGN